MTNGEKQTAKHLLTRRNAVLSLLALSGTAAVSACGPFRGAKPAGPRGRYRFPQGVASGDPTPSSVVLWTRAEPVSGAGAVDLIAQVSRDESFASVIAEQEIRVDAASDYTARLIVDNLEPARVYYYRFIAGGDISEPLGRTRTAPAPDADHVTRFAYASCQHIQLGYMTPYRRMMAEDRAKPADEQVEFVLHLGDFIYEEIWYPEDRETFLRRRIRDTARMPTGGGEPDWRWPVTLEDYRAIYKAYLADPDLKAARARWPFICVWDDHEFSNNSWQSQQVYDEPGQPAQRRKVVANQAWFEFIPAFLTGNPGVEGVRQTARDFEFADVENRPLDRFDEYFQSTEPNNLAAINSLLINRSLRWGRHVELVLTDCRTFRSPPVFDDERARGFTSPDAPWHYPEEIIEILDAGRTYNNGAPPEMIEFAGEPFDNFRRDMPPGTILGPAQKRWFKETLAASDASWKLWGNSIGALSRRVDFQNLPEGERQHWRGESYGVYGADDWLGYPTERAELLDFIQDEGVSNVVSITGDRHNFFAGYLSATLPPERYEPVAIEFTTSSITTPTSFEAAEYVFSRREDPPLEYFAVRRHEDGAVEPNVNISITHGVAAAKEYAASGSLEAAIARSKPDVAPHLVFGDMATHGYATARVDGERFSTEFVAFRRPVEFSRAPEGDEPLYRVAFEARSWAAGGAPRIAVSSLSGAPPAPYGNARFNYGDGS